MSQTLHASADFLVFVKEVGFHRGNPRIYFQDEKIQRYGFTPGTPYTLTINTPEVATETGVVLTMRVDPQGKRKVCKKVVGKSTFSFIDINVKAPVLDGRKMVSVSVTSGSITLNAMEAAQ